MSLAPRLRLEFVAGALWKERCKETINLSGAEYTSSLQIIMNTPLQDVVLIPPSVTWE